LVPLTAAQDMNRDGLVNTTDVLLVRVNQTTTATRVSILNLTGTSSGREDFESLRWCVTWPKPLGTWGGAEQGLRQGGDE
jgi:hypothetical protein